MAHVQKRNGKWQARYRSPDGKEHARRFDRKTEAERWLATAQADLARGTYVDPRAGKVTLSKYAEQWLARMTPTWRPATAALATNNLTRHVLPRLGARPVASLRKGDIEALCASLPLAPSTVAGVHQNLGQLLGSAVDDGLILRNPAYRARLPKREASKAQPVELEVVERVRQNLPGWLQVAVPLGIGAGLRQGEASGLSVDRVDFLRRTVRIDRQLLCRYVPEPVLAPPKTASSHRTIPLADFLLEALAEHLRRFPTEREELVLRTPTGLPVDADRFGHQWRQACRAAGVPGLKYHVSVTPSPRRCCRGACR